MKKFSFSLQKLLNYKEQLFDIERNILVDMRAALIRMQEELEGLRREHDERSATFNHEAARGTTAQQMELHKMYMRIVDYNIEAKMAQIELQNRAIDKQADKVREAKIEISALENLKERKLEEYNYMDAKATEQFIEEFVSNAKATAMAQQQ